MNPLSRGFRERRRAQALQDALERYERALSSGVDAGQARSQAETGLGDLSRTFTLATSLAATHDRVEPDEAFVRRMATQIRQSTLAERGAVAVAPAKRRAPRFMLAPLATAAAVVATALILIPSFRSLPGDPLYAMKGASEDARVWFATGPREARIRLGLADTRFQEVERLLDRSRVVVMGGPGISAAPVNLADISDPRLARLIEGALRNAGEQLEVAAQILTTQPAPKKDIDRLVEVTTRGHTLAVDVADDLPHLEQQPVLQSVVKLSKIEAKARAAQKGATEQTPAPQPCDTPSPTPTVSPTPTPTPTETPTATPTTPSDQTADASPSATPTPTPTATPEPTPCATPDATPTPTPTPTPTASTTPTPSDAPATDDASVQSSDDGAQSTPTDEPAPTPERRHPLSPFGQLA